MGMGEPIQTESRFIYTSYLSPHLSIAKLDELAEFVIRGNGTSYWGAIIAGAKLLVVSAYYLARSRMVDSELIIRKQHNAYLEQAKSRSDLDGDDLSSEPRSPEAPRAP